MIAKCKPIPHGATAMTYNNKKEKAELVGFHGLPADSTADNFWSRMMDFQVMKRMEVQAWKPLKNTALRFEVSPENKYTEDWTLVDWHQLALEFLKEVDGITRRPPKKGKRQCELKPTNLLNSQFVISLHHDSKSGIRHLHILVNRVDMDGQTNDAHYIGERAVEAANRITERRGWDLASDHRAANIEQIYNAAISVLSDIPRFDWADFISRMNVLGYGVKLKFDNSGKIRGMWLTKGHSTYKSSELGHGRNFMPSKIETIWRKLHKVSQQTVGSPAPKVTEPKPSAAVATPVPPASTKTQQKEETYNSKDRMGRCTITFADKTYTVPITKDTFEHLDLFLRQEMKEQDAETDMDITSVAKVALLLFAMYVDAATSISESCGGGGGVSSGWGKRDDEDELKWLRRCARQAVWMCKPMGRRMKR